MADHIKFSLPIIVALMLSSCAEHMGQQPIAFEDCAVEGATEKARCGTLEVPENWDEPGGRKISLNIVVAPAMKSTGRAPLFDLAGGPGLPSTGSAGFYLTDGAAYRAERDIVLVDQRGTGASSPLRCPELERGSPLARMYPPDDVRKCKVTLEQDHDLRQYTTLASIRDLDAVRAALGADKIDLFGLSYGTKFAQAYIREFPDRVRSAILMSAAPMDLKTPLFHARNAEETLQQVFDDCAADAECAAAYPSLMSDFDALVAQFAQGPVRMNTPDGELDVERGPFMEAMRGQLGVEIGQRRLPRLIAAGAKGDFAPFVKAMTSGPGGIFAEGLYLSLECAEGAALIDDSEIEAATANTFLGRYRVDEQRAACAEWPIADVPPAFSEPVVSDVPVLLISGGRDYVTPTAYSERIVKGFVNGRLIVIDEMSHSGETIGNIECIDKMASAFYAAADASAVDSSCVAGMKAPPFELSN